jgi:hypothetical protein
MPPAPGRAVRVPRQYRAAMLQDFANQLPDPPGGVLGAWFNAIVCGALAIGLPIIMLTTTALPGGIFLAVAALAIMGLLETLFVTKLVILLRWRSPRG